MDPSLQSPSWEHPPDVSFPVEYQILGGDRCNRDLKGDGTLVILRGGESLRFSGRKRSLFSQRAVEREFKGSDILGTEVEGRSIRFSHRGPGGGAVRRPFIFFARNVREAAVISTFLPNRVDGDASAARDFRDKVRLLPGASSPWTSATNIIIALNVVAYLVMAAFLGAGWIEVTDMTPYIRFAASNAAATTDGQWWRLLTSMFAHYGLLHLALNMWALYQSGHLVERLQGRALYCATYLGSGLGSGFLSMAWHGDKTWSAGASGAIFGVIGALLGYMLRERQALPRSVAQPLMRSTLAFAGYNLVFGVAVTGIDNAAHVGGFVTGIALGWLTAPPLDVSLRRGQMGKRLAWAAAAIAALTIAGVAAAPRYDYSPSEELALGQVLSRQGARETSLVAEQDTDLQSWQRSAADRAALGRLTREKLVPFYSDFIRAIDALHLSPGRRTARRRGVLDEFIRIRLEAYGHLIRAADEDDAAQFALFNSLNAKADALLNSAKM